MSSSNHRLRHTRAGAAVEEEPTTIHSHRDDDGMRRPVVHLQQPNVIARLMGIDAVPTPPAAAAKPAAGSIVQFQAQRRQTNNNKLKRSLLLPSYTSYNAGNSDDAEYSGPTSRLCFNRMMMVGSGSGWRPRPRPRQRRRHPHEEELLQKMRQDLQAWQASRAPALLQTSGTTMPSDHSHGGGRSSLVLEAIAQEDLRRQKMARYGFGFGLGGLTKFPTQQDEELPLIKSNKDGVAQAQGDTSEHAAAAASQPATMPDDRDLDARRDGHGHGHGHGPGHGAPAAKAQELLTHRHTPILLLKPATTCSESDATTGGVAIGDGQKTSVLLGLPKLHRDANMSILLQEVRDRVQRELTVLTAATATGCGNGKPIKAPALHWAIPPLQQVTKEDRGKPRLFRSESFRAFRRDRKRNGSPEAHILKSETAMSPEKADGEESLTDASLSVLRPGVVGVTDGQSFRSECLTLTTKHRDDDVAPASPRLLFRSFSAPESGFSFSLGRLFSSNSMQHESSELAAAAAAAVTTTSKNVVSAGFSSFIRGTLSSLRRHGFSSRRNPLMFRRKTHWSSNNNKTALGAGEIHPAKMEMEVPICAATPPSHETFNLFKVAQASLSELPPSPVSPLEVAGGHSCRHFFTDLHFTLPPELSPKCLSEFEAPATASESSFSWTDITAVETAWSREKAYITEVLIAAGLYDDDDGPSPANARVDSMARPMPICDDVFEDVEDMYYYRGDYIGGGGMYDGAATDHRMLFDLANEALQRLVAAESSRAGSSSLRRWVVDSTGVSRGKKLVDEVWEQVQALRKNPEAQEMQTIDGMVASEVRRCVWAEVLYEDVYAVGRKIERVPSSMNSLKTFFACAEVFR